MHVKCLTAPRSALPVRVGGYLMALCALLLAGVLLSTSVSAVELATERLPQHRSVPAEFAASTSTGWSHFGGLANGCNGQVLAMVGAADGSIYVGGEFSACGDVIARRVARFDPAAQTWESLGSAENNGVNDTVRALAVSGNVVYVGGSFNRAGNVPVGFVAQFDRTSSTWNRLGSGPFSNGVNGRVDALAVSGSAIYAGGFFTLAGGASARGVAKYQLDNQLWSALGGFDVNGVSGAVQAIAVAGEMIYVGGTLISAGGIPANRIARFNSVSQTWIAMPDGLGNANDVRALAVSGSKVYVGGSFTVAGGAAGNRIATFDTASNAWASLGSGVASGFVTSLGVTADDIYVAGAFSEAGGGPANNVARFNLIAQSWSSLGSGTTNGVLGVAQSLVVSAGRIYVGGEVARAGGAAANWIASFDPIAQLWLPLGNTAPLGVNHPVRVLAVDGDELFVGGSFTQTGAVAANRLARYSIGTGSWTDLGGANNILTFGQFQALDVSGVDLFVGGTFFPFAGTGANVARLNRASMIWSGLGTGFSNGVNNTVNKLAVRGNFVYVAGLFTQAGELPANRIARFDSASQSWAALGIGPTNGVNNTVSALAVSTDSVYVGGPFTQAGGLPVSGVARFDVISQSWAGLGTGVANGGVSALVVAGDSIYIGGSFTEAGGLLVNGVARFDVPSQTWTRLGHGAEIGVDGTVNAIAVVENSVYIGGAFTRAGGISAKNIARFDIRSQYWSSLGEGSANGVDGRVLSIAALPDGAIFVGGNFGSAGGQVSSHLARYRPEVVFVDGFD